jgi:hypothetical protein
MLVNFQEAILCLSRAIHLYSMSYTLLTFVNLSALYTQSVLGTGGGYLIFHHKCCSWLNFVFSWQWKLTLFSSRFMTHGFLNGYRHFVEYSCLNDWDRNEDIGSRFLTNVRNQLWKWLCITACNPELITRIKRYSLSVFFLRFDSELQLMHDELRQEKQQKDRISREKELIIAEKYSLEQNLSVSFNEHE